MRGSEAPPPRKSKALFGAPQGSEPAGALAGDQRFEAGVDHGRLLRETGHAPSPFKKFIVEDEGGAHMSKYGCLICICQEVPSSEPVGPRQDRSGAKGASRTRGVPRGGVAHPIPSISQMSPPPNARGLQSQILSTPCPSSASSPLIRREPVARAAARMSRSIGSRTPGRVPNSTACSTSRASTA